MTVKLATVFISAYMFIVAAAYGGTLTQKADYTADLQALQHRIGMLEMELKAIANKITRDGDELVSSYTRLAQVINENKRRLNSAEKALSESKSQSADIRMLQLRINLLEERISELEDKYGKSDNARPNISSSDRSRMYGSGFEDGEMKMSWTAFLDLQEKELSEFRRKLEASDRYGSDYREISRTAIPSGETYGLVSARKEQISRNNRVAQREQMTTYDYSYREPAYTNPVVERVYAVETCPRGFNADNHKHSGGYSDSKPYTLAGLSAIALGICVMLLYAQALN